MALRNRENGGRQFGTSPDFRKRVSKPSLAPWLRGPYQLIEHAHGHLQQGSDADRIIALIGFDQAIEVCVDVFINLHPRLRGRYEVPRDVAERALRNFHTKLEFLEAYAAEQRIGNIPGNHMVWFHNLRNELYHSGNGMVPELHVLEGARAAAVTVFLALFEEDISQDLGLASADVQRAAKEIPSVSPDPRMELLRVIQDAEESLKAKLGESVEMTTRRARMPLRELFRHVNRTPTSEAHALMKAVDHAESIRNSIAHGADIDASEA